MSQPITQAHVESEIVRLSERAEKVTHEVAKRARADAEADVAYKVALARAYLAAEGPVAQREAEALVACEAEYAAHRGAEAVLKAAVEAGRNVRSQLDALRSINANVRAQVTG